MCVWVCVCRCGCLRVHFRCACVSLTTFACRAHGLETHAWRPQVAKALECPLTDQSSELVNCLRDKSVEELLNVRLNVPPFTTALGPIVDNIIVKDDPQK